MSGGGYGIFQDSFVELRLDDSRVSWATGWGPDGTGSNTVWYRRYGLLNQVVGNLKYTGTTVAAANRSYGTVADFTALNEMHFAPQNSSYDGTMISSGIAIRAIMSTGKILSLYRNQNATWALTSGEALPINVIWISRAP